MHITKFLIFSPEVEITQKTIDEVSEQTKIPNFEDEALKKENYVKTQSGIYHIQTLKIFYEIEKYNNFRLLIIVRNTEIKQLISTHFNSTKIDLLCLENENEIAEALTRFIKNFIRNYHHQAFMNVCESLERIGGCLSRSVSAIIVRDQCIIAESINSSGRTGYDCLQGLCDFCAKRITDRSECICTHAEANAINKLKPDIKPTDILYCTTFPCINCTHVIIDSGIKTVFIRDFYKEETKQKSLELLGANNIEMNRLVKVENTGLSMLHKLI